MRGFFSRNKSVFIIGFITLLVFLAIIVVSEIRRQSGKYVQPKLVPIDQSQTVPPVSSPENEGQESAPSENFFDINVYETTQSSETVANAEMDEKYGVLQIAWDENGFTPKNAKAVLGQKVKWVNTATQNIFIEQTGVFFSDFSKPHIVPAGGEFEYRLNKEGIWNYQEQNSKITGSIFIIKP